MSSTGIAKNAVVSGNRSINGVMATHTGSISIAIAVGANRAPGSEAGWTLLVSALLGCAALALSIYLMYRFAESVGRILGETSMNIFIRLSSFILVCIGVQIVWNGVSAFLHP
jgi:multiple antibiotic resistance protein